MQWENKEPVFPCGARGSVGGGLRLWSSTRTQLPRRAHTHFQWKTFSGALIAQVHIPCQNWNRAQGVKMKKENTFPCPLILTWLTLGCVHVCLSPSRSLSLHPPCLLPSKSLPTPPPLPLPSLTRVFSHPSFNANTWSYYIFITFFHSTTLSFLLVLRDTLHFF